MDSGTYETDELLSQYLLFHYGSEAQQLPWAYGPAHALNFPVRCVEEGLDHFRLPGKRRALDIGCAVGRASFELSRHFEEVIGIDYSAAFIDAARKILVEGSMPYLIKETGTITTTAVALPPVTPLGSLGFEKGDAQELRPDLGQFDFVLAANLLCRLGRPAQFLESLPGLLVPSGQLVITTPNTWLEEFTAREFWIGATPDTGRPLEALQAYLDEAFIIDKVWDMPFLIREHHRKYQWSVAQASRWIRRN